MNDSALNITAAHYVYIPTEDYQVVKSVWEKLVQAYGLSGLDPDETLDQQKVMSHYTPTIVRDGNIAIGLLIIKKITVIEILCLSNHDLPAENFKEIDRARELFSDQTASLIGEATVVVFSDQDGNKTIEETLHQPFSNAKIFEGDVADMNLSFIESEEKQRHYYLISEKSQGKASAFLTSKLPDIDSLIFKLARESAYFKEQLSFIKNKKTASERNLSDILHQWGRIKSSSEHNIETLEKNIGVLSTIYSDLAGNLKLVKTAQDIIRRDLARLDNTLKGLVADQEVLTSFKNACIGGQVNLLRDLEYEDNSLHRSLDDTRATIEVVRTRVELERGKESVMLQKEGLSVQTAAGFIELFIVGFYTLEAWELLASHEVFAHIPVFLRLGIDTTFAITVVGFTHYMAKFIQKKKVGAGLIVSGLGVFTLLGLMIFTTSLVARG